MCILSGIYVWAKIVEVTGIFQQNLVWCIVHNSLTTWRLVMKLNWNVITVLGFAILSKIYVLAKIAEVTATFSAKLGLMHCLQLLLNNLQDCYETWWGVKLPYGDVYIVRNSYSYSVIMLSTKNMYWLLLGVLEIPANCVSEVLSLITMKSVFNMNCMSILVPKSTGVNRLQGISPVRGNV